MTTVPLVGGVILAAVGFALWVYLRREPPVPGRAALAALRACVLALVVLLLWNPDLPWGGAAGDAPPRVVLLDASRSMAAGDSVGGTAWSRAVAALRDEGGEPRILLFGSTVRVAGRESLEGTAPTDESSLLTPALERAASLGAAEVRVLSDLRLDDPVGATRAMEELGLHVRFEDVAGEVRNAGLGEVEVPSAARPGGTGRVEVLLHGEGGEPGDSVELTVRGEEDELLARRRVALPGPGRPERHALEVPVPEEAGRHRVRIAAALNGDGFAADDVRVGILEVDPDRSPILLLSFRPDWEPRFLLPVLGQVTGLDVRGYLGLSEGRWLPMGRAGERSGPTDVAAVRERVSDTRLLVVHGLDAGAPEWVDEALEGSPGSLVFVGGPAGARRVGVPVAGPRSGEWYPSAELPPSPLTGELAGAVLDALPPLTSVFPLLEEGGTIPLRVRRGRSGPGEAALLLQDVGGGRRAVTLASGFWRWAAREGEAREAYRRLWAGVAGWLLGADPAAGAPGVSPPEAPVARGAPPEWRVRGLGGDSLRLRVRRADTLVTDTVVAVGTDSRVRTPPLPPGTYRWEAAAEALPDGSTGGELEVSSHSSELLRRAADVERLAAGERGRVRPDAGSADGRPLRTHPVAYLGLIVLLSVEWIGRRRQGLR